MTLQDKTIIVTGAAGGIGQEIVRVCVEQGANVVAADLKQDAADATAEPYGKKAVGFAVDVTSSDSVGNMVKFASETFGKLDGLVNNAGISHPMMIMDDDILQNFNAHVQVNQVGVLNGITHAARQFIHQNSPGVIINISSIYAFMAAELTFSYNVSKAAVKMMTQSAALELGKHNIRVVGVAPGRVDTPMLQQAKALGIWDQMRKEQMRAKFTQPAEIANVVAFLASDAANAINGSVVAAEDGYLGFKFPLLSDD